MNSITVKLAEIPIEIKCSSRYTEDLCRLYLSDDAPLFFVSTTKEKVQAEMDCAQEQTAFEYAESLCLYREIAEKMPLYNRVIFHCAAIEYDGKAYIFTAPSGTGKSTHISLWREYFNDKVKIINGDKPIISLTDSGFFVCGTPYAGKEKWHNNISVPLAAICIISQGKKNSISKLNGGQFIKLFQQTYRPQNKDSMQKTISIVKKLCEVPCYALSCDISKQALKTSYKALTGLNFPENTEQTNE